ncbi:MAG: hypothetical protein K8H88_09585, partial [Sandaracinaceae bacterium]|nr:hypothetical protein [Sandaracinaceae bacterium]
MQRRRASCGCEFGLGMARGELGSEPSAASEAFGSPDRPARPALTAASGRGGGSSKPSTSDRS